MLRLSLERMGQIKASSSGSKHCHRCADYNIQVYTSSTIHIAFAYLPCLAGAQRGTLLRQKGETQFINYMSHSITRSMLADEKPCRYISRNVKHPIHLQDFYSVHGENAVFIAKSFYKTTAVVKTMGSSSNNLQGEPFQMHVPAMYHDTAMESNVCTVQVSNSIAYNCNAGFTNCQAYLMYIFCRCHTESQSV